MTAVCDECGGYVEVNNRAFPGFCSITCASPPRPPPTGGPHDLSLLLSPQARRVAGRLLLEGLRRPSPLVRWPARDRPARRCPPHRPGDALDHRPRAGVA